MNTVKTRQKETESSLRRLFVRHGRLRSGWRLVSYLVVNRALLIVVSFVIGIAIGIILISQGVPASQLSPVLTSLVSSFQKGYPIFISSEALQLALTFGLVYIWRHWLDKRDVRSLGLQLAPGWWQEFLIGMGLVATAWALMFAFSLLTSTATIQSVNLNPTSLVIGVGLGLVFNLLVGFAEELDARGYVLQTLEEGVGFVPAVAISSVYFGALHLLNPGAGPGSTIGTFLFGVLAAVIYWRTRRLWMPIGMHAAWNFMEGPVLGFLVSGLNMGGLFTLQISGPEWLMGGSFGPEAGALTWAPLLALIALVLLFGQKSRSSSA